MNAFLHSREPFGAGVVFIVTMLSNVISICLLDHAGLLSTCYYLS